MRAVSLLLVLATAVPAFAQERGPIRASIEKAAAAEGQGTSRVSSSEKGKLFWPGLVIGIVGVSTSALGLTTLRTEDSSTGNAPTGTYQACVAQKNSNPIYAASQCDALKGKNLKLLWGGVALSGLGAAMMIGGLNTSAELSAGSIGLFHRVRF